MRNTPLGAEESAPSARVASGQIGPQPGLVDLPVAVLAPVEQHHRQPVAELRAQGGVAGRRGGVDVDGMQVEAELVGQSSQLGMHLHADRAAVTGQQLHLGAGHGYQCGRQ